MLRRLFVALFVIGLIAAAAGCLFLVWGYHYITRDLPRLSTIADYRPPAVSSVFANDGSLIAEFFVERRYPVKLSEVPVVVRRAFLAAEDASFYEHPGIDPLSILRAVWKNFRQQEARQGGSTITQQVVKNLLLNPEKTIRRKIKEAILSYRLEKRFSKDEIFEIYLNQIFFGNTAYGIKAAARLYFHKELGELTLSEASILAGLPKAPSRFSPILHQDRAKRRQRYVLSQMVKANFITEEEAERAARDKVALFPADSRNIYGAPFYVSEIRRVLGERWKELNIDTDGLSIHTAVDLYADRMGQEALRRGLQDTDKRRGWRGPLANIPLSSRAEFIERFKPPLLGDINPEDIVPAWVTQTLPGQGLVTVEIADSKIQLQLKQSGWARRRLDENDHAVTIALENALKPGDVVEISQQRKKDPKGGTEGERFFVLDQTPEIEGALVLLNPYSGEVLSAIGGYSYQRSQFNRATQSYRQPGSSFKPIVYLAAVDGFHYTPATLVYDAPRTFKVGDQFWTPGNFDEKYLGAITLRSALEKSRNLVSADIVSRIGVDAVIQYAKKLGIESRLGRNLSLALGSSEVTPLEITRAYGVFPAKGVRTDSVFVTKIIDRNGQVLYDSESDRLNHAEQVISEDSAFIMANMMKGVVEHGTGYRVRELGRPVAGKTGTSNEEMDTWFVGYTPEWVCGVWVGFDIKKRIGEKETGGRVAAPVFLQFMRDFLRHRDERTHAAMIQEAKAEAERLGISFVEPGPPEPLDFSVPEGVDPYWVDKETGVQVEEGAPGAILEYFIKGTEPPKETAEEQTSTSYLESPEL